MPSTRGKVTPCRQPQAGVQLGAVEPERPHLDQHPAALGNGHRQLRTERLSGGPGASSTTARIGRAGHETAALVRHAARFSMVRGQTLQLGRRQGRCEPLLERSAHHPPRGTHPAPAAPSGRPATSADLGCGSRRACSASTSRSTTLLAPPTVIASVDAMSCTRQSPGPARSPAWCRNCPALRSKSRRSRASTAFQRSISNRIRSLKSVAQLRHRHSSTSSRSIFQRMYQGARCGLDR